MAHFPGADYGYAFDFQGQTNLSLSRSIYPFARCENAGSLFEALQSQANSGSVGIRIKFQWGSPEPSATTLGAIVTISTPVLSAISGGVTSNLSVSEVFVTYGGLIIVATAVSTLFFKDFRKTN
jgi:hypothetical protein